MEKHSHNLCGNHVKGLHRSGWVELELFQRNSPWWVNKNLTQPNLIHIDQVGPMSWTYIFLISIINIKLRIRIIPQQIRANL